MDTDFRQMLETHLNLVHGDMNKCILNFMEKSQTHDVDKIFNNDVFSVYDQHFTKLKKIPFGTSEYLQYEQTHFPSAHSIHAQNDHHYYSHYNNSTKPNILDLLEVIIDINASNKQYGDADIEIVMDVLNKKGVLDISMDVFVRNTIEFLNS